ncbi:MAG: hypothetical protein DMD33_18740 [Gemmatimonadetes bacterium]|nr:MAG: hypothetical protein DMD33_18740 [Gemmatimonadota bacterium]
MGRVLVIPLHGDLPTQVRELAHRVAILSERVATLETELGELRDEHCEHVTEVDQRITLVHAKALRELTALHEKGPTA